MYSNILHARYVKPTLPKAWRGMYNIPTGHSLLLLRLCTNFAKVLRSRKQRQ